MNRAKRKGTGLEVRVRDYFRQRGYEAERLPTEGKNDRGDIQVQGVPWVFECKATVGSDLGPTMNEAKKEAVNAGVLNYCVVKHRSRHSVDEAFVIMPLWMFVDVLSGR